MDKNDEFEEEAKDLAMQRAAAELMDKIANSAPVKYPHNVLEGFGTGCLLDLRVRLAIGFLNTSPLFTDYVVNTPAAEVAAYALDMAEELLSQAQSRGWIDPLPVDGELTGQLRLQAKRTASYQALQQVEGQRAMADAASPLVPMAPGVRVPGRH